MKADAKPTLEDVAELLVPDGSSLPEWLIPYLRYCARLVGDRSPDDNSVERKVFESALILQDWLPMYVRSAELICSEYPDCAMQALEELIPFLATQINQPQRHRPTDNSRYLCAAVCMEVWRRLHGEPQPYSPKLQEACEAYWQACGWPETSTTGRLKNWEPMCIEAKSQSEIEVGDIVDKFVGDHLVTTPKIT